jgi:hypothetical protein
MKTAIYAEPSDVESRLGELGLTILPLTDALKYGHVHRSACTPNDPPMMRGIVGWGKSTRALREMLAPYGWVRSDEGNFSITLNPDRTIAISIQTGDDGTGFADRNPSTKHPKGPATADAVGQNAAQLSFDFPELPRRIRPPQKTTSNCMTWLFLSSPGLNEIRCELSLPKYINDDGHVEEWAERIILNPIPLDHEPIVKGHSEDYAEDIIVPISRRKIS